MASVLPVGRLSLYRSAANAVASRYTSFRPKLEEFPDDIFFDVVECLYVNGKADILQQELSDLAVFARLLRCKDKRDRLHLSFQRLGAARKCAAQTLAVSFSAFKCQKFDGEIRTLTLELEQTVQLGLSIGTFLNEAGHLQQAKIVFNVCLSLLSACQDYRPCATLILITYTRFMHTLIQDRSFEEAEMTLNFMLRVAFLLENEGVLMNKASIYALAAEHYFAKNIHAKAFTFSRKALEELDCSVSLKVMVDTFRLCGKCSVMKRDFATAGIFAKQAVKLARLTLGEDHRCYTDALLDYAYYLLNADLAAQSIPVYEVALQKRQQAYGPSGFLTAVCYEELAYALYIHEYSSGEFTKARELVQKAIDILNDVFTEEHLLLASTKRVKALIVEEVALDQQNADVSGPLLQEAQTLYKEALKLILKAYGEYNVQTAKHYGNLGRLYQSMGKFTMAEEMHLRAIKIKEQVLGTEDYEVALSIGHLASLYNYDMNRHEEAEELYLRSIAIGLKLFGPAFSSLEYDYRGLVWLYTLKHDTAKVEQYEAMLDQWSNRRKQQEETVTDPFNFLVTQDDDIALAQSAASAKTASPKPARHYCVVPFCSRLLPMLRAVAGV